MSQVHNFSAGPCILPQEVLKKASEAVINFNNLDLSLIEISHRSVDFVAVMDKATSLVKELLEVPAGYSVIFLQGGASTQFLMVAYNLLTDNGVGAYVNTGAWASKAIKEAGILGKVEVLASSEDKNFTYIPKGYSIPENADYLHITSNNTIFGTQLKEFPECPVTLVCDMSSDIFSKKINVSDFDLIYAGAQKNMGPAGVTMVIVKDEILGKVERTIPSMLDYRIHIKKESMFNTPPVFSVYVSMLTLEWLKSLGGVEAIQMVNEEKAALLYAEIDRNPMFRGVVEEQDRSAMNATFVLEDESMNDAFNQALSDARINGLKGHRSVGGFRASMYNALPLESVQVLVNTMTKFSESHGN
ncbi:MAG TPA: 3-phosphoserine/phosphohydroxythreonine transaminase [Flavobacteriales bacterium]|nr:3-phosphoserine/phosphohydroxythreonine transaminase [Flavobacteriales bacterium]HIA11028.1 3-phosphoserine/phosphohydroxythreonine transaminase [Flavobacteriales bacterium]